MYDEAQAFHKGTIFPELDKPFFITALDNEAGKGLKKETRQANTQETMLLQIQQVGFVLDDLRLYLDTHPEDRDGITLLKAMLKRKKTLMREFAIHFYPLTPDCMADTYENNPEEMSYCWPDGKIPWERSV